MPHWSLRRKLFLVAIFVGSFAALLWWGGIDDPDPSLQANFRPRNLRGSEQLGMPLVFSIFITAVVIWIFIEIDLRKPRK